MILTKNDFCCAISDLGHFNSNDSKDTILRCIREDIEEDIISGELPRTLFTATTRSNTQQNIEKHLEELGFKAKKFKSRFDHGRTMSLKFWTLHGFPKPLRTPEIRSIMRTLKRYYKGDLYDLPNDWEKKVNTAFNPPKAKK